MKKTKYFLLLAVLAALLWSQRIPIAEAVQNRSLPVEERIHTALTKQQDTIPLMGDRLSERQLTELWSKIFSSHSDLFFVSPQYEYTLLGDTVLFVRPQYSLTVTEANALLTDYEAALSEILATVNPHWTDLQKALYLHDYLCTHSVYDESLEGSHAPQLLLDGTGTCQAYTFVYADLLQALGIPCSNVISLPMNHAWNLVTLDGKQYHVDVTFDDPLQDRMGRANHRYFLLSDTAISSDHPLTEEEGAGQCPHTTYDDAFWRNVSSAFVPIDESFYFIKNGSIYSWDGTSTAHVFTISATWFTDFGDGSYWNGSYSALWAMEDRLLYNTPHQIMALNPKTGESTALYTHTGDGSIFGFTLADDRLTLQIASDPNESGTPLVVTDFTV